MDAEQLKQSNRQRVAQISKKTETVLQLADKLERLADQLEGSGLSAIAEKLETFNEKLSGMPEQIAQMQSVSDKKLNAWISQVNQALSSIELNPQFQVDAPNVEVTAPSVDLSPITNLVSGIEKSINSAVGSIKMPEQEDRTDELKEAMEEVRDAINGLIFPVAEHPLPFKDSNGKPIQVQLDADGKLPTTATLTGGGDATAANQTTIIGHVDGIEGLLTTIDADTGNLPTIETNTDFGTVVGGGTETGALRVTVANNSTGVLSVDDNGGSLTVDGTVTASNVSGDIASAATDSGNPVKIGGKYSSTKPTYTDGQRGNANIDTRGNLTTSLYVADSQNAANYKADNADAVAVSATIDKLAVQARNTVFNGTTWDRMPGDTTGVKIQDGGNSITVDGTITANAGTGTMAVSMATNTPVGNVAHDTADSGAPIKVGAKAISALSGVTLVASADRTDLYSDLDGAQVVKLNGTNADYVSGNASNTDGTSTQVIAAGPAGIKHYITDVTITNTSASNIYVELKDGATAKWTFPVPANSGVTHSFSTPLGGTAATAWNFDPSAATTTVYCSASGFKSKV